MLDTLPLKHYQENYQALLDGEPLPHGNMRGKVLKSQEFWRDYGDYEPVLRQHIPEKYHRYFSSPPRKASRYKYDEDYEDDSIEIGRSHHSKNYNLSPIKKTDHSSFGMKDSEKLVNDIFESDMHNYINKPSRKTFVQDEDLSESLFEQTYKTISLSGDRGLQGEKLTALVKRISRAYNDVQRENCRLKNQMDILKTENEDLKYRVDELKDENQRVVSTSELIKKKFDKYYSETVSLKAKLQEYQNITTEKSIPEQTQTPEKVTPANKTIDERIVETEEKMRELKTSTEEQLQQLDAEKQALEQQKGQAALAHESESDVVTVITVGEGVIRVEQKRPHSVGANNSGVQIEEPLKSNSKTCIVCSPTLKVASENLESRKVRFTGCTEQKETKPAEKEPELDDSTIYRMNRSTDLFDVASGPTNVPW